MSTFNLGRAEVKLGDIGSVAFGAVTEFRSTTNVTLDSSEQDDFIASVMPQLVFRNAGGLAAVELTAGLDMLRYDQLTTNDAENFKSDFTIEIPGEPAGEHYAFLIGGGFNQMTTARPELLGVVQADQLHLYSEGRYFVSEYVSLRGEVNYLNDSIKTQGFADVETVRLPFAVYYRIDENLSAGAGYEYTVFNITGTAPEADADVHAFYLGIENLVSPLLQYELLAGYEYKTFDEDNVFGDISGVFARGILDWFITERSTLELTIANEFNATAANQSSEVFTATVALQHELDDRLSFSLGASYIDTDYIQVAGDRSDDEWSVFAAGQLRAWEERLFFRSSVEYVDRSSSLATANYDNLNIVFSASVLF